MDTEEKERAIRACNKMKALGIPVRESKPVLLNLLELFDWNWEPVEAEDYRALIDAYFEFKENEELEDRTGGIMKCEGSEGPSKKFHLGEQEDHASVAKAKCGEVLAIQEDKMPITTSRHRIIESSQPCLGDRRTGLNSQCPYAQHNSKRKDHPTSSHLPPSNRKNTHNRVSAVPSKQLLDPHGSSYSLREDVPTSYCKKKLIKPKTEKPTCCMVHLSESTPVSAPGLSVESFTSQDVHIDNEDDALASNDSTRNKSNFDIASSALGEVKLSLNCKVAPGDQNFMSPSYDAVLKLVEHKYLRSDKIVGPQFSVNKLLTDLCDTYLELGNKFAGGSITNYSSPQLGTKAREYCSAAGQNKRASNIGNIERYLKKPSGFLNSSSLVNVPNPLATSDKKRLFRHISDITKGAENVKISLVADTSNEDLPIFTYIPHNIIYQNAYVHISLARIADEDCCSSCSGDCLSLSIPCACARETGGEFAYTSQSLLKEEFLEACMSMAKGDKQHLVYCQDCPIERSRNEYSPEQCKGHIVRKFIKECWRKCGCNMQCGNRLVQRGITCKLQVFLTPGGKGWGLRTLQDLPKGTFVCEYVGEVVTNLELYERNMQSGGNERHTYPVTLDADWGSERVLRDEEALCLDATFCGNVARFINHRCFDANLIDIPVEVETPDRHYYHLAFFTKRRVDALEELTWDYGIDFTDHDHPIKAFQCCCGSAFCRDLTQKNVSLPLL